MGVLPIILQKKKLLGSKLNYSVSNLVSSFNVDTISGIVQWTDTNSGTKQYDVYSSTNGGAFTLLATTAAGATSYTDTGCKQNASVVYKVKTKGTNKEASASALVTPLCWKTNQSTLTPVVINTLNIAAGKTVTVNWGDGTSQAYTGNNSNITKNFAATGQYNISLSGDTDSITSLSHNNQSKSYGIISNWILPSTLKTLAVYSTQVSGNISGWILPSTLTYFSVHSTQVLGSLPQITAHPTNAMDYRAYSAYMSDSNVTVFRKAMTVFNVSNQNVAFSTANIDKLLKAIADYYETNAPTNNCTFNLSGANMGIPTGGASNADIVRLVGYYTAASKTATVTVRTS